MVLQVLVRHPLSWHWPNNCIKKISKVWCLNSTQVIKEVSMSSEISSNHLLDLELFQGIYFVKNKKPKCQTGNFRRSWYDDKSCTICIEKKYLSFINKVIEKYHSNARFCLVSNYVSKIIPALQSRCTRFKFKQISFEEAKNRIIEICRNERLNISHDAIEAVFKLCQGDMRRVVNMLQSLSMIDSS